MVEFTINKTAHGIKSWCIRKPILSGPLECDIGKVWDMSEIATEHKVYVALFCFEPVLLHLNCCLGVISPVHKKLYSSLLFMYFYHEKCHN